MMTGCPTEGPSAVAEGLWDDWWRAVSQKNKGLSKKVGKNVPVLTELFCVSTVAVQGKWFHLKSDTTGRLTDTNGCLIWQSQKLRLVSFLTHTHRGEDYFYSRFAHIKGFLSLSSRLIFNFQSDFLIISNVCTNLYKTGSKAVLQCLTTLSSFCIIDTPPNQYPEVSGA